MLYDAEVSDNEQWVIEQAEREGLPLPQKIIDKPTLLPGLEMYRRAFYRLSTCRQVGMGLGPIPYTAILEYARAEQYDEDHRYALVHIVEALDAAYLQHHHKKSKSSD